MENKEKYQLLIIISIIGIILLLSLIGIITKINHKTKEPLLRTVKRAEMDNRHIILLRILAIFLSLVAGGVFVGILAYNPFEIYKTIVVGAFRSAMAVQATVKIMDSAVRKQSVDL